MMRGDHRKTLPMPEFLTAMNGPGPDEIEAAFRAAAIREIPELRRQSREGRTPGSRVGPAERRLMPHGDGRLM